jgi:hypothetical protein
VTNKTNNPTLEHDYEPYDLIILTSDSGQYYHLHGIYEVTYGFNVNEVKAKFIKTFSFEGGEFTMVMFNIFIYWLKKENYISQRLNVKECNFPNKVLQDGISKPLQVKHVNIEDVTNV